MVMAVDVVQPGALSPVTVNVVGTTGLTTAIDVVETGGVHV